MVIRTPARGQNTDKQKVVGLPRITYYQHASVCSRACTEKWIINKGARRMSLNVLQEKVSTASSFLSIEKQKSSSLQLSELTEAPCAEGKHQIGPEHVN